MGGAARLASQPCDAAEDEERDAVDLDAASSRDQRMRELMQQNAGEEQEVHGDDGDQRTHRA